MELAVRRDLRELGSAGRSAFAELALVLARAIDSRAGEAAGVTTTAKLVAELRVTLGQLREMWSRDGSGAAQEGGGDQTPVWDTAQPGAPDVGSEGGGGGPAAGETVDAAPAADR